MLEEGKGKRRFELKNQVWRRKKENFHLRIEKYVNFSWNQLLEMNLKRTITITRKNAK
jgi:hypothetical protein